MIRLWSVLDLNVFRRYESDYGVRREIQDNRDGTHFIAYDILSFPPELIIATSPTMTTALERGVNAIDRLRSRSEINSDEYWRQRREADPPPDLQTLINKHGGYLSIPSAAWEEWHRQNAAWQLRRRVG